MISSVADCEDVVQRLEPERAGGFVEGGLDEKCLTRQDHGQRVNARA